MSEVSVYEELQNVLSGLQEQRREIQKQMDSNDLQIHEAECFAEEILNKDEEDFTVFSPRRYEDIYRTQLDQSNARKIGLQNQNKALSDKRDELDVMIHLLESLSADHKKQMEDSDMNQKKNMDNVLREKLSAMEQHEVFKIRIANELENHIFAKLNEISRRIELSQNFFTQDPMRAKLELSSVVKEIEGTVSDMTNMISDLNVVNYDELSLNELLEKALYRVDDKLSVVSDFEPLSVSCETWENRLVKMVLYQFLCKYCAELQKYEDVKKIEVSYKRVKNNLEIHLSCDGTVDYGTDGFMLKQLEEYISVLGGTVEINGQEIIICLA